ncbi:hypothetical protein C7293_11245 [filamentous cyanobacterium CCT1]|nr:hypothetical protein C7293_11245 [filamentous cyanobacterium CCT1]PSN79254.1 hypothetical protein C8B47_12655 [filamentous cyanobacterium CCP4]
MSAIRSASGIWLEDYQGRRFMDFHGNSAHNLGYGHPRLIETLQAQLQTLSFVPRRYTCAPAVELAEMLTALAPGDLSKVLLATSGSDAIEIALAYARAATGRFKTLSFWDAYHGAGFGARSIGGEAMFRSGPIGPLLQDMMTRHPLIGDVRGRGCLIGVELVKDRHTKEPFNDAADDLMYKALGRGLSFKVSMGNIVILSPPLTITPTEMYQALEILDICMVEIENKL